MRPVPFLRLFFSAVLGVMVVASIVAGQDRGITEAVPQLVKDPWVVATLIDLGFSLLLFYCWVWWRESRTAVRLVWGIALLLLGNIATAAYMLRLLFRLKDDATLADIFLSRPEAE